MNVSVGCTFGAPVAYARSGHRHEVSSLGDRREVDGRGLRRSRLGALP